MIDSQTYRAQYKYIIFYRKEKFSNVCKPKLLHGYIVVEAEIDSFNFVGDYMSYLCKYNIL